MAWPAAETETEWCCAVLCLGGSGASVFAVHGGVVELQVGAAWAPLPCASEGGGTFQTGPAATATANGLHT